MYPPIKSDRSQNAIPSLQSAIRQTMSSLPDRVQPFLTWLTATPLASQTSTRRTSIDHLRKYLLTLMLGLIAGWVAFSPGSAHSVPVRLGFALLSWGCVLAAARKLQIVVVHHCSHLNFFRGRRSRDITLGRVVSFLLMIEPFDSYRIAHARDHHFSRHMTKDDPTVEILFKRVGLMPGASVSDLRRRLFLSFLSPRFYLGAAWQRLRQQSSGSITYRIAFATFWLLTGAVSVTLNETRFFALAWLFPLFVLYPISSALRLAAEHTFPSDPDCRKFDLASMSELTNAVFCGEAYPGSRGAVVWWIRVFFVHLPIRLLVLVGDTPVHDHHHRNPSYADWPNYPFARHQESQRPKPGFSEYREVWGYSNALQHSLESLSRQKAGNRSQMTA